MRAIGFENFRKFKEFPTIQFGDITILIGCNNAGKSTVVKAIVTMLTFLKEARFDVMGQENSVLNTKFYFNKNQYAHIGTFKRALYNGADNEVIKFKAQIEEIEFEIELKGDSSDEHAVSASVQRLAITDNRSRIHFEFFFCVNTVKVHLKKNRDLYEGNEDFEIRARNLDKLKDNIEGNVDEEPFFRSYRARSFFSQYPVVLEDEVFSASITDICEHHMIGGPLVSGLIYNLSAYFEDLYENDKEKTNKDLDNFIRLVPYIGRLRRRIEQLLLFTPVVEYLYAHSASQVVLYNALNTNDFLVQTIHNFANKRFDVYSEPYEFVRFWMSKFKIGTDFIIKSIGGEAHTMDIIDENGKAMPLADKGMGSIQIMILLLRLAIDVYNKGMGRIQRNSPVTILVEEPEQNLHPHFQSLLLDFFYQVSQKYNIRFVIETHSEYLIRRTQVIVAKKKFKDVEQLKKENPFKVYYFPADCPPYIMQYNINGRFINTFGEGFFDEASSLALLLSKMSRK